MVLISFSPWIKILLLTWGEVLMMLTILTFGGTIYTAYQAFNQDTSDRQTLILSATAGLVFIAFFTGFSRDILKRTAIVASENFLSFSERLLICFIRSRTSTGRC
jgi:hypothetical protein